MKKFLCVTLTAIFALMLFNTNILATGTLGLPPMKTSVLYGNESKVVINKDNNNSAVKLKFTFSPRSDAFDADFIIKEIVNKATNDTYQVNKSFAVGDLAWTFEQDVYIPSTKVGKTVEFEIHWQHIGGSIKNDSVEIEVVAPNPKLSVEAVVDSTSAAPGTLMQVKYVIKNIGNVPVRNILITDKAVSDINGLDTFTTDDYLSINGTIIKFVSFMLDGEITLSPAVTFTYDGKGYENQGEQVKLISEEVMPEISLTCDSYVVAQKGAEHTFNYFITNTSPVKITNIRVYDSDSDNANLVEEIEVLEVSQSTTGTFTVPIEKSGFYKFKIVYTYETAEGDKTISAKTDKSLKLPNEVYLQVSKVEPEYLTEPGKMTFTVLIENSTTFELRNIVITEESGLFEKISLNNIIIPAIKNGEPGQYSYTIEVNIPKDETTVLFNLGYSINDEHSTINTSYDVNFTKVSVTASPSPTPPITEKDNDNSILWIVLILIFLLIILALIIVLIILKNKNSKKPTPRKRTAKSYDDEFEDYEFDEDSFYVEENEIEELEVDESFNDKFDDEGVKIYKRK